ncbi:MAG: hypothetical protein AAFR21_03000, partial [Pseudomonadota bacterium]
MPYGLKRGVKAPGQFTGGDIAGLALAGATGIISALVADYSAKADTAAIFTLNRWVNGACELLGLGQAAVEPWVVILMLIVIGAGSIFYFQPITRQGAYAQGFGLLAVIMTMTPANLADALEGATGLQGLEQLEPISADTASLREASLVQGTDENAKIASIASSQGSTSNRPTATDSQEARLVQVQQKRSAYYTLELTIQFQGGVQEEIEELIDSGRLRGRLHNKETGQTFDIFRSAGGDIIVEDDTVIIRAGVPARSQQSRLYVRLEANGYAIAEESAVAEIGDLLEWSVVLRESSVPIALQRLRKPY